MCNPQIYVYTSSNTCEHISFDMLCIPQVYTYSFLLTYMLCAILRYVYTRHLINVYSFILTSCVFLRNMYIRLLWYSWCMLPATPEEFHGSSTCDDKSANVHTSLLTFFSVAQPRKDFTAVAVVTANLLLANNVETISFIAGFGGAVISGVIIFVFPPVFHMRALQMRAAVHRFSSSSDKRNRRSSSSS